MALHPAAENNAEALKEKPDFLGRWLRVRFLHAWRLSVFAELLDQLAKLLAAFLFLNLGLF